MLIEAPPFVSSARNYGPLTDNGINATCGRYLVERRLRPGALKPISDAMVAL